MLSIPPVYVYTGKNSDANNSKRKTKKMFFLLRRVLLPGDDCLTAFRKKVLLAMAVLSVSLFLGIASSHISSRGPVSLLYCVCDPGFLGSLGFLLQLLLERRLRNSVAECMLYLFGISMIIHDWLDLAEMSARSWPIFVVLVDIALVCDLPVRVNRNLIAMVSIWLIISSIESSLRFGLFDIDPIFVHKEEVVKADWCDCAQLPCPVPFVTALDGLAVQLTIFLLDFYFTRGFASDLQKERKSMQNVITASEWIAECLSRFDLEGAETALTNSPLPPPLQTAFDSILANLHTYRPYLPQSCFETLRENEDFSGSDDSDDNGNSTHSGTGSDERVKVRQMSGDSLPSSHNSKRLTTASSIDKCESPTIENYKKLVTSTVTNMLGSQKALEDSPSIFLSHTYDSFMTAVLLSVRKHGGVVGVVVGDHVHSSFNAAKRCVGHARRAADSLMEMGKNNKELAVSSGLCSGSAHCGPVGNNELKVFAIMGQVAVTASLLERFGRHEGHKVTCDGSVQRELAFLYDMRLLPVDVTVRGREAPLRVFEVTECSVQAASGNHEGEWLYHVSDDVWSLYNTACLKYLIGEGDEAVEILDAQEKVGVEAPQSVRLAVESLREAISMGASCSVLQ